MALVACFAMLFGQFSGLLHALLVPHVRCATHGELTHVDEAQAADEALAVSNRAELSVGHPHGHSHEHCSYVAVQSVEPSVATASVSARASLDIVAPAQPSAHAFVAPQVSILLVAPKSSPPV